jgi:hypothetical protein
MSIDRDDVPELDVFLERVPATEQDCRNLETIILDVLNQHGTSTYSFSGEVVSLGGLHLQVASCSDTLDLTDDIEVSLWWEADQASIFSLQFDQGGEMVCHTGLDSPTIGQAVSSLDFLTENILSSADKHGLVDLVRKLILEIGVAYSGVYHPEIFERIIRQVLQASHQLIDDDDTDGMKDTSCSLLPFHMLDLRLLQAVSREGLVVEDKLLTLLLQMPSIMTRFFYQRNLESEVVILSRESTEEASELQDEFDSWEDYHAASNLLLTATTENGDVNPYLPLYADVVLVQNSLLEAKKAVDKHLH